MKANLVAAGNRANATFKSSVVADVKLSLSRAFKMLESEYEQTCERAHHERDSALQKAAAWEKQAEVDLKLRRKAEAERDQLLKGKMCAAERALAHERERTDRLQRRLEKLEAIQEGQETNAKLTSAIKKISKRPLTAKRLAAAVHPDKNPGEFEEVAKELFGFIQQLRESA